MNIPLKRGLLLLAAALAALVPADRAAAVDKLSDETLFSSSSEPGEVYRWSEGSTINLEGKKHLMMVVSAFGQGGHDQTEADLLEFHSHDGGLTWTPLAEAKVWQKNIGNCNVMSPSLLRLDNGEILGFFMVKEAALEDCGPWVKRSADNGKTWSDPVRLPYEGYGGAGNDRAIQISTGRVILPCWVSMDKLGSTHVYCFYSDDRGKTWQKTDLLSTPAGSTGRRTDPAAEEPMVLEREDGRLMMIMRAYLKSIWVSYSEDEGGTWTKPETSGIPAPGSMSTIKRMPNGDVLLIWNWAPVEKISGPWPRDFITSAISKDDGRNFTSVRHLDGEADFQGKITMANVCFSEAGAVITYSKSMTKKNAYNWRLQVIPIEWFYEGDTSQVYGESYLPTLEAKVTAARATNSPGVLLPARIPRPTGEQRKAALARLGDRVSELQTEKDLVAAYTFEEEEGEFVYDVSAGGNDLAVLPLGKGPTWVDGKDGKALKLSGTGGPLVAPDSPSLQFPEGTFTVEVWVYPTAERRYSAIVSKEHVFQVGLLNGQLKAAVYSAADEWGEGGWLGRGRVPLDRWTHIVVTFDGQAIRFYQNGVLADTAARKAKMAVNREPLTVGGLSHVADSSFAGRIDELSIRRGVQHGFRLKPNADAPEPRRVGRTHQLFLDDQLIACYMGLDRVLNRPVKHHANPVLTYTQPWEGNCTITWGSVLYEPEEELFKIWYEAYKKFPPPGENGTLLCYATSRDGLTWQKPKLGQYEYRGSKENNIILLVNQDERIDAPTVFRDPDPTPERKYRLYWYSSSSGGVRGAASADGMHWTPLEGVLVKAGDRTTAGYDPQRKKFYVITRIPGRGIRTCGLWESDDGVSFEHVKEIAAPDGQDPPKTQFYGMITFPYAGMRLGFLEMFYVPLRKLNTQLMYSRDGLDWHRAVDRQVFLQWGPPGSWEQTWVTPSHNPPIRVGDKLYLFYQGRQTLHWAEAPFGHVGSIGLAVMRPDGFASLEFVEPVEQAKHGYQGTAITAPLLLVGETLHLNVLARPGTARVEVLDIDGNAIPGFTLDNCQPITMVDRLDQPVRWQGDRTLKDLADKPVRLRFHLQAAKLYSFWME